MVLRDRKRGKGCVTRDGHEQQKYAKEQKGFLIPTLGREGAKPVFLHIYVLDV